MDKERIHELGVKLSVDCKWLGEDIARIFCEALTDSNFHKERKKIVPEINKVFSMNINPIG